MPISRPDEDWRAAFARMREDEDARVEEAKRRVMRAFVRRLDGDEARARQDAAHYGTGILLDGKRVPPEDFFKSPEETASDARDREKGEE